MKDLVQLKLRHAEECMNEYWARDRRLYLFYQSHSVACRDLLLQQREREEREYLEDKKELS